MLKIDPSPELSAMLDELARGVSPGMQDPMYKAVARIITQAHRIAELEAALRNARAQIVTLGGEALHVHGDGIQRAVLNEIDAVLKHSS